jgi:hypothetical protein
MGTSVSPCRWGGGREWGGESGGEWGGDGGGRWGLGVGGGGGRGAGECRVGRCRLIVSQPDLKACLVSALEAKLWMKGFQTLSSVSTYAATAGGELAAAAAVLGENQAGPPKP